MFYKHPNKQPSQVPIPFLLKCLSNFVHAATLKIDCPISDKICTIATNYSHWSNVGGDRKFVEINSSFTSVDRLIVTKNDKIIIIFYDV